MKVVVSGRRAIVAAVESTDLWRQHARPRIEPAFGLAKTNAWLRKIKLRGLSKVHWLMCFAAAAFNLRRLTTLMAAPA